MAFPKNLSVICTNFPNSELLALKNFLENAPEHEQTMTKCSTYCGSTGFTVEYNGHEYEVEEYYEEIKRITKLGLSDYEKLWDKARNIQQLLAQHGMLDSLKNPTIRELLECDLLEE
jgi:hypothetical protein